MIDTDVAMVFVVDDDPQVRASIQGLLKSAGLRSECFETAEQFLQRQPPGGPSCLIVDVSLPGISGLDFQQQLKKAGLRIPIVFITAHGDIPMTVKAMKSGAVEFLTKPFEDQDLLGAVQQALASDTARRGVEAEEAAAAGVFVHWGVGLPMSVGALAMNLSTVIVAVNAQLLRHLP